MTVSLDAANKRREREVILEMLALQPHAVDKLALRYAMADLGYAITAERYERHLQYLIDRGYIAVESRGINGMSVAFVTLTAKGVDVIDGITDDPGVGD